MAEMPNVVHRIAIFDSHSRIVNIISQSDIVRYALLTCQRHRNTSPRHLLDRSEELGEYGQKTVGELGFGRIKIVSVPPELSAIEALGVKLNF